MRDSLFTFRDGGQDFLRWQVQQNIVVGCWPFQASIWCGRKVLSRSLSVGDKIKIRVAGAGIITIHYPITAITSISPSTFVCPHDGTADSVLVKETTFRCRQCRRITDKAADDAKVAAFIKEAKGK